MKVLLNGEYVGKADFDLNYLMEILLELKEDNSTVLFENENLGDVKTIYIKRGYIKIKTTTKDVIEYFE